MAVTTLWVMIIQSMLLLACWLPLGVLAFTGVHQRRISASTININLRDKIIQSRSPILSLGAISGDDDESEKDEDGDPLLNDQREGMADAVSVVHVYNMVYIHISYFIFNIVFIQSSYIIVLCLVCWIRFFNC